MNPMTAGLLLFGILGQAQTPRPDPNLRSTFREAIQQAGVLRKTQESLAAALTANKASRAMVTEQVAMTEKSLQALRVSIEKIDEKYDSLSEVQQSVVREAWSLARLLGVFVEYLKDTAAKPDSTDRDKDLISNSTSTARRAVMLEETLSRLNAEGRPRGGD